MQPARPYTPTDKAAVERTFGSINTLFCQHIHGYVGSGVAMRGKDPAAEAVFTVAQLQELFDEWVVAVWQNRPHESLTTVWGENRPVSPNEAYAAMVARSGYVPVPRSAADYVELLPAEWRRINEEGVTFNNRVYDTAELNPYRRTDSGITAQNGRWELHHDPYDITADLGPEPPRRRVDHRDLGAPGPGPATVQRSDLRACPGPQRRRRGAGPGRLHRPPGRRDARPGRSSDRSKADTRMVAKENNTPPRPARPGLGDSAPTGDDPAGRTTDHQGADRSEEPGAGSAPPTSRRRHREPRGRWLRCLRPDQRRLGIAVTPPPVGPLTDLCRVAGVRAPRDQPTHAAARGAVVRPGHRGTAVDVQDRIGYHAELLALQTPDLHKIVSTGRSLLLLNHRQHGARRGLLVSGAPTTGKSTAITQLGRAVELAFRRTRPRPDDGAPVVYLTMPPQATPKSLSIEILKFLGAPYLARASQIELTRQACHLLADLGTQLILVDEIHNLNHHTRAGADASDHLKYLAENVAATFVYAGIDTARTGLFNDVRGRQLAGRFVPIHTRPFGYATTADRDQWRQLVNGFDSMLRLHHQKPGDADPARALPLRPRPPGRSPRCRW